MKKLYYISFMLLLLHGFVAWPKQGSVSYDTMVLLVFIGGNMLEIHKACDANT
jgi:hypothetical protein